jgi:hypothetical protein
VPYTSYCGVGSSAVASRLANDVAAPDGGEGHEQNDTSRLADNSCGGPA